jgi:hypothetical protein
MRSGRADRNVRTAFAFPQLRVLQCGLGISGARLAGRGEPLGPPSTLLTPRIAVAHPNVYLLEDSVALRTMASAAMDTTTEPRPLRALEDASGRRLRRMRWIGRGLALLFLLWFTAILLGALGVGPAGRVPFGRALRPSAGPPRLRRLPLPQQPAPADLVPALPATAVAASAARSSSQAAATAKLTLRAKHRALRGRATVAPLSAVAPRHVPATLRGRSSAAPGHLHARGAASPGRLRHTATTATTTTVTTTGVTTTTSGTTTTSTHGRGRTVGKTH